MQDDGGRFGTFREPAEPAPAPPPPQPTVVSIEVTFLPKKFIFKSIHH